MQSMPLAPDAYGLARLPKVDSHTAFIHAGKEIHVVDLSVIKSIGRCTVVGLIRKFPRAWKETLSLAFIARKLKPHLNLRSRVDYIARRYLIERSGANLRNGRIVRIAKTNEEITILGKLIVTKNEAKAKQLRMETTIDGTRGAVWQEIRAILGDTLFSCLESSDSITDAVSKASSLDGRDAATHWRRIAKVRARIIRP